MVDDYLPFVERISKLYGDMGSNADPDAVEKVVASIFEAGKDSSDRLRYTPTNDIKPILDARRSSEQEYGSFTRALFAPKPD
jgi:hypothetical protein